MSDAVRLNLGCGRSPLDGWVNVDAVALPGVDLVLDLERETLPFDESSVDEIAASHMLEHVARPLPLLQELHRVARPGCVATFRVPYGSSDDADEDPTHARRYFWGSWGYFGQPYYWRADYGYRGDWDTDHIELLVGADVAALAWDDAMRMVRRDRNVVGEMVAQLRAVKPIREPRRELQRPARVLFRAG